MSDIVEMTTTVAAGTIDLPLELCVPDGATHLLLSCYAFGLGLVRDSYNSRQINKRLQDRGIATLEFNLLGDDERDSVENKYDVPLLTSRLLEITDWVREHPETRELTTGYFGTSSGAGPALRAATRTDAVAGVITRSGRIDFAPDAFDELDVPLLMLVGSEDEPMLTISKERNEELGDRSELYQVEGAPHVFDEEFHEVVTDETVAWFTAL